MTRFELETPCGSLKEPQVVGLPGLVQDAGTDVNEAACPFDLEAAVMVWGCGLILRQLPLFTSQHPANGFANESAALAGRAYYLSTGDYDIRLPSPEQIEFKDALNIARQMGASRLRIFDESLQIIEEYPL